MIMHQYNNYMNQLHRPFRLSENEINDLNNAIIEENESQQSKRRRIE